MLSKRATERAFHLCYHRRSTESNAFRDRNWLDWLLKGI